MGSVRLHGAIGVGLVDQILFSGTTLVMSLLLARYLSENDFGAYSTMVAVVYMVASVQMAAFGEPIMALGARKPVGEFRSYVRGSLLIYLALQVLLAPTLCVGILLVAPRLDHDVASLAIGMLVAASGVGFLWLGRAVAYSQFRPERALSADAIYATLLVVGSLALVQCGTLTAGGALVMMGIAGALGGCLVAAPYVAGSYREAGVEAREALSQNWGYGRWNLMSTSIYLTAVQLPVVVAPLLVPLTDIGGLAVVRTLWGPINVALTAMANVILPRMARSEHVRETSSSGVARRASVAALVGIGSYAVVMAIAYPAIISALYGGRYASYRQLSWFLAIMYGASALMQVGTLRLKAGGRVSATTRIWVAAAIASVVSLVPLARVLGVAGIVLAQFIGYSVAAVCAAIALKALESATEPAVGGAHEN